MASITGTDRSLGDILSFQEQHDPAKASIQPFHGSSHPGTKLPIAEFLKETEVQEKPAFYKIYNFYADFVFTQSDTTDSSVKLYLGFLRSLQNRPSLSLVILHHSWKSYLS